MNVRHLVRSPRPIGARIASAMSILIGPTTLIGLIGVMGITVVTATASARPKGDPIEWRAIDGANNNRAHPGWGTPGAHLLRGASGAHYADGISALAGPGRPSPRVVSNRVHDQRAPIPSATNLSDYIWTWGQFLDHDLGLTEGANEAAPIAVPAGDPYFDPLATGTQAIGLRRSVFDPLTGITTPRQQLNEITGYIDASNVYGSDDGRAAWLRTGTGGRLQVSARPAGDLLPYNDGTQPNAGSPEVPSLSTTLFVAGDIRANEQPTLAVMHTLLVREHNWWADRIARETPGLSDEEIYQRARRMVIAEVQHITYEEFLPCLIGARALPADRGYRPDVDPGIAQVFSTAGYRLGHTLLSPVILRLDEDGASIAEGPLSLRDAFFAATPPLVEAHGIEPFLRGLAAQRAQELDRFVIDDVRNFLFGQPGQGGLDLVSLNVQRGRDHGLPDFNSARADLGLPRKATFAEVTRDAALAAELEALYGTPDDMDLFTGLLAEDDVPGAIVGETLRAILVDQFTRSRDGDRFFYTRYLDGRELAEVNRTSLADIIRRNTSIRKIQCDVFHVGR